MCFDLDSLPPIPAISGAAVSHDDLELEAADGAKFAAFLATPEESAPAGVVILPDVRGLYGFYEELALRFAERGYAAIAFDYFGRTAGVEKRDDDFEYMPHVQQTSYETVQADVAACVARLQEADCTSIFSVGFCFGGRASWLAGAAGHGLKGSVGFYGMPGQSSRPGPSPIERAADMGPTLALQAGADQNISHEVNTEFAEALEAAGVDHELVEYEGAPHSFFDRKQEEFQAASDDAWRRTLSFIDTHS